MAETTITGLPNATTPLSGTERVPMDQNGVTVDASTQDIADLAPGTDLSYTAATRTLSSSTGADVVLPEATTSAAGLQSAADRTRIDQLGADDSPTFAGLTITGTAPVVIPHIHGSIAGDFYVHVRNTSGGQLTAGTAVYATGSVGDTDRIEVAACDPTNAATMPAIGILQTTLAQNGDGDALILGELRPFNTGGYQIRDRLYVGAGGALVASPPASGLVQYVGSVARVNAETGTILVGIGAAMARVGFTGAYGDLSGLPTLGTAAALDVGTTAGTVAAGDDARLSDARTPTAHKSSHAVGGADALTPADIGAATSAQGGLADSAVQPGDLATVATSGAYADLSGHPTIPAAADAAPQPLGAAAVGSSTDYAREDHVHDLPPVVSTTAAGLQPATSFGTITYAATVNLDLAALDGQANQITLTGSLQLAATNLTAGRTTGLLLDPGASERTITFPVDWRPVGTKPASIPANKLARLTLECWGTNASDVLFAIAIQP